ncbi:MAG: peptidyl-prolyl cis-trans isomerase [Pseudothermotoga sp.]
MREWFKRWQKVIVWIIAGSFIAGIAWWSVASYFSGRTPTGNSSIDQAVGYIKIKGSSILDVATWVLPSELDSEYSNLLSRYGINMLDPLFQEPQQKASLLTQLLREKVIIHYAKENKLTATKKEIEAKLNEYKKQIEKDQSLSQYFKQYYGSVDAYLTKVLKPAIEKSLIQEKVMNSVAKIDTDEMKKYFEENLDLLRQKYDKADVKLLSFSDENQAKTFMGKLLKLDFDSAASEMNLSVMNYPGLTRGIFDEKYENDIFSGATGTVIGPVPLGSSWYVLQVENATVIKDFNSFMLSDAYETEKSSLQSQKMQKWYDSYVKQNDIELVFANEIYDYWKRISETSTPTELEQIQENLKKRVFSQDGTVFPGAPDTLKSAYIVLIEKIQDSLDSDNSESKQKWEKLEGERSLLVKNLYEQYPSSLEVVRRMYDVDKENLQVKYNYFSLLYSEIKPYLYPEYLQYLLQSIIEVQAGFSSIALDTKASTEMRASSYYNLYDLSKSLEDATSARFYLEELRKIDPNYIDFEAALGELK